MKKKFICCIFIFQILIFEAVGIFSQPQLRKEELIHRESEIIIEPFMKYLFILFVTVMETGLEI